MCTLISPLRFQDRKRERERERKKERKKERANINVHITIIMGGRILESSKENQCFEANPLKTLRKTIIVKQKTKNT